MLFTNWLSSVDTRKQKFHQCWQKKENSWWNKRRLSIFWWFGYPPPPPPPDLSGSYHICFVHFLVVQGIYPSPLLVVRPLIQHSLFYICLGKEEAVPSLTFILSFRKYKNYIYIKICRKETTCVKDDAGKAKKISKRFFKPLHQLPTRYLINIYLPIFAFSFPRFNTESISLLLYLTMTIYVLMRWSNE